MLTPLNYQLYYILDFIRVKLTIYNFAQNWVAYRLKNIKTEKRLKLHFVLL